MNLLPMGWIRRQVSNMFIAEIMEWSGDFETTGMSPEWCLCLLQDLRSSSGCITVLKSLPTIWKGKGSCMIHEGMALKKFYPEELGTQDHFY